MSKRFAKDIPRIQQHKVKESEMVSQLVNSSLTYAGLMQMYPQKLFLLARKLGLTIFGKTGIMEDVKAKGLDHLPLQDVMHIYADSILKKAEVNNKIRSRAWQVGVRCENLYNRNYI